MEEAKPNFAELYEQVNGISQTNVSTDVIDMCLKAMQSEEDRTGTTGSAGLRCWHYLSTQTSGESGKKNYVF